MRLPQMPSLPGITERRAAAVIVDYYDGYVTPEGNVVAHYTDQSKGDWLDASGGGHNAALTGSYADGVEIVTGGGASIEAAGSWKATVTGSGAAGTFDFIAFGSGESFSIELWAQVASVSGPQGTYLSNHGGFGGIYIMHRGSDLEIALGSNPFITVTGVITTNVQHIVVTADGSGVRVYVDGVLVSTSVPALTQPGTDDLVLGSDAGSGLDYLDGRLDAITIRNAALDAAAITRLRNGGL